MTNEEYELLVYDIVYQALLEKYQSYYNVEPISEEYLLEKKSEIEKMASKYLNSKLKEAEKKRQRIDQYRRTKELHDNATDPKDKKRLSREMENLYKKHGVNDQSKHPEEHVADAVGKSINAVKKGISSVWNKIKPKDQGTPTGLAQVRKQTDNN